MHRRSPGKTRILDGIAYLRVKIRKRNMDTAAREVIFSEIKPIAAPAAKVENPHCVIFGINRIDQLNDEVSSTCAYT
jgi:hypothetical protein